MRSRLVVAVSIIIYLVAVFNFAFTVSATALQDPDCCWILALGKRIWHERRLPDRDPFSYSIALAREGKGAFAGVPAADLPPCHFVAYQWLAETVFYGLYRINQGLIGEKASDEVSPGDAGTYTTRADRRMKEVYGRGKRRIANEGAPDMAACALTAFAAVMVVAAFMIVPLFYSRQQATSVLAGLGLVLLATWAASFHFYLRPELFSYLFLSIIACLAVRLRVPDGDAATGDSKTVKLSLLAFCITALWTNLHVGFVLAPLILLATAAVLFLCRSEEANQKARAALCAGLAALAATALNPQGPAIWAYLPRLFFPSMNALIYELQPVGAGEILSQAFLPFTLFTGTAVLILLAVIFRLRHLKTSRRILLVFSVLVIAVSLAAGFASRRLIPCSVLLVVCELFLVHALFFDGAPELFTRRRKMIAIVSTVFVAIGTAVFESSLFPPRIPQTSLGFLVPYDAMSFVESKLPGNLLQGNLLNDPQFGDLMIWHLSKPPALFIDTRFDAYGNKIVRDYFEMANCFAGWQELLDRHRIAWVFLPPYARLSVELEKSPSWKLLFKDSAAVIFLRSEDRSTSEE
ncbi:MAG: hypothetical protein AB7V06_01220 [Candidatus Obscuribacterales bacterium]